MLLKLVGLLVLHCGVSMGNWCGYQPSWRLSDGMASNDKTVTYLAEKVEGRKMYYYNLPLADSSNTGLDLETGIFTAPADKTYIVTLTAVLSGLGYIDTNGALSSYAQLFILKNGKMYSMDNYLLVEHGKVGT
eukprot:TRINITY_DN2847_c0_g2_i1.p1 TRINITY_DN2847_c0_g2~~TRINITY_DN2847_c0_g2_i1.p1  ORF type:complete len:133 (+),score=25.16 TRINITY_DN2847_c0_g2_i1:141-539(+)